ncbi:MAG: MFS transporter [Hyphomicrobiales bacterium]|nr:MFS transporter [Hyphomicrobiales bacterium]
MSGRRILNPRNVVLLIVCLMYLITYMDRVNIATSGPAMQKELGLSHKEFGFAISAFAYPYAFFQIAGGWLGDFLGARWTLVLCGAIWSAATVLIGYVEGFASLFAARVLLGFGEGAAFPTATRALAAWTPTARRGFAQGITHAFARFGNAITPPIFAALIAAYSWRAAFVIAGIASAAWVVVWWWYFRDDPREHTGMQAEDLAALPDVKPRLSGAQTPWLPLLKRIMPVTLTDFCYGWTLWVYISWMPSFFLHEYNIDLKKAAILSSAVLFAGVVGDTVGGVLSDAILRATGSLAKARVSVIVLGFVGAFVCTAPVLLTRDLFTVSLCLSGAFFFAELIVAPIWAVPMDIAPEYSGTASGFMNFGFGVAGMVSPVVFGWIIDATGRWDYPFIASLGLLLAGAVFAFFMRPGERFHAETSVAAGVARG